MELTPKEIEYNKKRGWWFSQGRGGKGNKRMEIFKLVVEGEKTWNEICAELSLNKLAFSRTILHPYFQERLKKYLNAALFQFQVKKIADLPYVYDKLREEFEKRLGQASDDCVVKEFVKLVLGKTEKRTLLPEMMTIFIGLMKKTEEGKPNEEDLEDLKTHFGYKAPNVLSDDTSRSQDPKLDQGKPTEDEQGTKD